MGTGNIPDMTGEKIYSYPYAPLIYNADKRPGIIGFHIITFQSIMMIIQKYTWQFYLHDCYL